MFFLSFIFSMVGVLLSIAFFTLMERKIMSLMHYRKGPNKVSFTGLLQPISDASKLLTKEFFKVQPMKIFMFVSSPIMGLCIMLLCWLWYESTFNNFSNTMKILTIAALLSLTSFIFLLTSWGSNTKYAIIGGYRAVSQIISYEVCLMLFIFVIIYTAKSFKLSTMLSLQNNLWFLLLAPPFFLSWLMMCLAESNRTPFDLAEGESEIVSGFNIEYGGGLFAVIFIMEYGMILFLSFLTSVLFLSGKFIILKIMLVALFYIWARCSFPRMRYDKLMMLCWKICLPFSLSLLSLTLPIFFF